MSDAPRGSATEAWTIASVLRWATDDFRARGLDSPRLDAELLLGKVLSLDRIRLIVESQRTLSPDELSAYRALIVRRRRAEPVAYIVGVREFFGMPFRVDASVLVPRPETELLVEVALARTEPSHLYGEALDLCTGSGCVAIAFGKKRPTWRVLGVDVSKDAASVATDNAERLGATWNTSFLVSDLDASVPAESRFDLITANPPYIPTAELATLDRDVRDHEPRLALDGGPDGLDLVRRVIAAARARLRPGGVVALEVGQGQAAALGPLLDASGFTRVEVARDTAGIDRVVSAELGS